MNKSAGTAAFLNRLLYAGIFSIAVLYCFLNFFEISRVDWKHITVLLVTSSVFSVFRLLSWRQRIYVVILGFLAFLFLFPFSSPSSSSSLGGDGWSLYLGELSRVFLLAAACFLVQLLLEKNIFLRAASAGVIGGWLLYMRRVPRAGVVFFVLYTSLTLAELVRERHGKMKQGSVQAYVLGILPFLLAYAVLLWFMPMPNKPYDWQWVKDIYRSVEEKITMYAENLRYGGDEYFDGDKVGFSEEGDLSGDIIGNETRLMTLGIGSHKDVPIYLAGKVFDSFNGREWENRRENDNVWNSVWSGSRGSIQDDISASEKLMDVIETVYALRGYTGDLNLTYYNSIKMDVSYLHFHTDYVMAPSKTWVVENEDKKTKYHYNGDNILFNKRAGYGTEYMLRFCQLNMEREEMYRFLDWNHAEDEKEWASVVRQYTNEKIPIEEIYAYREIMKERYLTQTTVSPEIEEWIAAVTADAKTDIEKLKYIESALAGMGYHTNPGKLPEAVTDESSFLDYFILEKGEGYCVHYATAFVLLARAIGFPARYVQGFCVPEVSGDDAPVYSDMAHAWPEVYIEGKGWIPFEPTPGFGVNRYLLGQENADSDITAVYTNRPQSQVQGGTPEPEDEMPEENVKEYNILPYLIRVFWILVIGGAFIFAIDFIWEKHRDKRRNSDEKYRLAVLHNLQILEMLGYKLRPAETYHELTERIRQCSEGGDGHTGANEDKRAGIDADERKYTDIEGIGEEDNRKAMREIPVKFIDTYERILYGTLEIDEQILQAALEERTQLLEILKERKHKTYLFCRIRLYIMRYR